MKRYALILASGTGTRAGGDVPKQFRLLCGKPLFQWSVDAFREAGVDGIIVVTHPDYLAKMEDEMKALTQSTGVSHMAVVGGDSRVESVKCGLAALPEDDEVLVAVHDAARPLVTPELIRRGFREAENGKVAVPVIPVTDSLRQLSANGMESESVDRSQFVAVQTPQIAPLGWLRNAYARPMKPHFTDDASILQDAGYPIGAYPGDGTNMKVTNPQDFAIAESLVRVEGLGFRR